MVPCDHFGKNKMYYHLSLLLLHEYEYEYNACTKVSIILFCKLYAYEMKTSILMELFQYLSISSIYQ